MKKRIGLAFLVAFLAGINGFFLLGKAQAQIDAFTFFIPYFTDQLDDQFDAANNGNFANQDFNIVIAVAIHRDNTVVYYDHWEDGLEVNLTSPTQPSTEIWGDNDPTNGIAPGSATDVLNANNAIQLINPVPLPRDPSQILYDGGDKLTATDGGMALTLAAWPQSSGTLFAGAWEIYPTSRWGSNYIIPVGVDLAGQRVGFTVVGVNVQAVEDNTTVELDLDADGTFEINQTLNQGQQFIQPNGVIAGAQIQASAPVQVHLFTGNPALNFESRAYTIVPRDQWRADYLAPRTSDGDIWLYNPDPAADLPVEVTTLLGTTVITIPAAGVENFPDPIAATITGVHFRALDGRPFFGLAALDAISAQDWGYTLVPRDQLTSQFLIGWGPGNNVIPPNGNQSPVYVTALDPTTVTVRYSNGATADFVVPALAEVQVTAPNNDMSGAFLFTADGTPFVAVWGQDQLAPAGNPSIDVGTSFPPFPTLAPKKVFALVIDADNSGTLTWGDTIRFDLAALNNSELPIASARIIDDLPPSVTYVPNSTLIDGVPIPDDTAGTAFPLDGSGFSLPGGVAPQQRIGITFDAVVNDNIDKIENTVVIDAPLLPPPDPATVVVPLRVAAYKMDKRLISPASGQVQRGEVITYGITITSTGNISITKLPLRDTFDENELTFLNATPAPSLTAPGVITWTDLATTSLFGPLDPGRVITVVVTAQVDDVPAGVTPLRNTATVEGAEGADGSSLLPQSDQTEVTLFEPLPAYAFRKRLIAPANGQSAPGGSVIFGLTITNTGNITLAKIGLRDTVNPAHLIFQNSTPLPDSTNPPGTVVWNNLTDLLGFLGPGQVFNITVNYIAADPLPAGVFNTTNTANTEGVEDTTGASLPDQSGNATVTFPGGPQPPPPGGSYPDDDDDDDEPVSPGVPPAPPPAAPAGEFEPPPAPAEAPPPLPVEFLPETGVEENFPALMSGLAILLLAGSGLVLMRFRRRS